MNPLARYLSLLLAALVLAPAAASAGTVTAQNGAANYTAAPGEINTIRYDASTNTLYDDTATVKRGFGCEDQSEDPTPEDTDPHAIVCPNVTTTGIGSRIDLRDGEDAMTVPAYPYALDGGDGNDVITLTGLGNFPHHRDAGALQACNGLFDQTVNLGLTVVSGGNGNDAITGSPDVDQLIGGDGDDTLVGGGGSDFIAGDAGNDRLEGGLDADSLLGGAGDDALLGQADGPTEGDALVGGAGADMLDGGEGTRDQVCYGDKPGGVAVDLNAPAGDGQAGENDSVVAVERIHGSAHADTITAGPGALTVLADTGDDTVLGGPASDVIVGGPGGDRVEAGAGDDHVLVRESRALSSNALINLGLGDQVACGAGNDEVAGDRADGLGADCERSIEGTAKWRTLGLSSRGTVKVRVKCDVSISGTCKGATTLTSEPRRATWQFTPSSSPLWYGVPTPPGLADQLAPPTDCAPVSPMRTLARAKFSIKTGRTATLTFQLSPKTVALIERRGCVPVRATVGGSTRTLTLR